MPPSVPEVAARGPALLAAVAAPLALLSVQTLRSKLTEDEREAESHERVRRTAMAEELVDALEATEDPESEQIGQIKSQMLSGAIIELLEVDRSAAVVPAAVEWLQDVGLLPGPANHRIHHTPPHDKNFEFLAGVGGSRIVDYFGAEYVSLTLCFWLLGPAVLVPGETNDRVTEK